MALIINGERVEDEFIAQIRSQLEYQHGPSGGIPEWEALGKDIDTFAKDMAIDGDCAGVDPPGSYQERPRRFAEGTGPGNETSA